MSIIDVDVIIIGTGTAALAAATEVLKKTRNFVIISNGVYGTTCVRNGCMPAKTLIHCANLYHSRKLMKKIGIKNTENIKMDVSQILEHTRKMCEHFLRYSLKNTRKYKKFIVEGQAKFLKNNKIKVNDNIYRTKATIIATGSSPIIPNELEKFHNYF